MINRHANRRKRRSYIAGLGFLACHLLPLCAKAGTARPADENPDDRKLLSKVVENLVYAWNKNDADAIAKLFVPDGVLVMPNGAVLRSRAGIKQRVAKEFEGKFKNTKLRHAVEKVALLSTHTAVVAGRYHLDGMKIMGVEKSPEGPFTFHQRKQRGRWMISRAEILRHEGE